jgi:hypothetical protein
MSEFVNTSIEDPDFPYLPPNIMCQPIIHNATLKFHNSEIPHPIHILEPDYTFGILDINIRSGIPINKKHIHLFFNIDTSSSMNEICRDERTKMKHIHYTLQNMLKIFYDNRECNISIHIQSFDVNITTIIKNDSNIRDINFEELTTIINKIIPCGSTNIELALQSATEEIDTYHNLHTEHEIVHILLTDGDITSGSEDHEYLQKLVPNHCSNIFIGYGIDHDSVLLSMLSAKKGNEYRFVDALENAGLVYGEIIHGILYRAIEDVTLTGNNIEFYNYQLNKWDITLEIGNLLSEQTKTYHVRSKNTNDAVVSIYGTTIIKTHQFQPINFYEKQIDVRPIYSFQITNDLSIYIFRQRTQELLYESKKKSEFKIDYYTPKDILAHKQKLINELKDKLKEFQRTMIHFMKDKNMENNSLMQMLCDDIYIAYTTLGTSLGSMYTCARHTSNGRQQAYICSATYTEDIYNNRLKTPQITPLKRQTNITSIDSTITKVFDYKSINDIDCYTPSQDFLSPFSNNSVVSVMRQVSGITTLGNTEDDESK